MMDFKTELQNLKALNLPASDFMVVSSGALAIREIREARDIDVIVTDSLWTTLAKEYPVIQEGEVERIQLGSDIDLLNPEHSWFGNKSPVPIKEMFEKADMFEGIRFINLHHLKIIKQAMGREKDIKDIELIDAYLGK